MGKVLKADASAAPAYVSKTLASDQSEVWLTMLMRFTSAALTLWEASFGGDFVEMETPTFATSQVVYLDATGWHDSNSADGPPAPTADVWHLLELHFASSATIEMYVDGTLEATGSGAGSEQIRNVRVGLTSFTADLANVVYVDDVNIGTSRAASDLFTDDFEDGTLDAWTSTSGDVAVVDDPFPAPTVFTPGSVFSVAFDDPTLEASPTWTQIG